MTTNVNVDPLAAKATFDSWGKVDQAISAGQIDATNAISQPGHGFLDGASFCLLKAEFLAAQAGVVPFIPLPGGGQGVMTVGAAFAQDVSRWPQPELAKLYMLNHKGIAQLHARTRKARPAAIPLEITPMQNVAWGTTAFWTGVAGSGSASLAALPAAWLVISAVGILATVATSYYATRTRVEQIQTDAHLLANQHRIGALTDLAQGQLATTGRIDPSLIGAINSSGSAGSWTTWPLIAIAGGGMIAGAAGTWALTRRKKR